jgi:C_GCAxxG_C_C family probable redox protein
LFWSRKNTVERDYEAVAGKVAAEAEGFYRSGKMHCAEAVLASIRNEFAPQVDEQVVRMAAGFGAGSGSGCICGAVSGGTMALGLVLDGDRKGASALTRELHRWFKAEYGATCCKVISAKGKSGCLALTGNVAGKVAELLQRKK